MMMRLKGILRTASAMANRGRGTRGFIIIGVADRPSDAARIAEIYSVESIKVGEYEVTGTQHELTAMGRTRDEIFAGWLTELDLHIWSSPLPQNLAESLTLFD